MDFTCILHVFSLVDLHPVQPETGAGWGCGCCPGSCGQPHVCPYVWDTCVLCVLGTRLQPCCHLDLGPRSSSLTTPGSFPLA